MPHVQLPTADGPVPKPTSAAVAASDRNRGREQGHVLVSCSCPVSQRNDQRRRCGEAEPLGHRTVGREKGDGMKGRFALIVAAASGQSRHARWDIISSVGGAPRGPSTPAVWPLPRPLTTR